MTPTLSAECDSVRASFREWNEAQTTLEAQVSESLAALAAYQSHLDNWQQQLAYERDELRVGREQLEHERAEIAGRVAAEDAASSALETDLQTAREKIAGLSASLLERTDELRALERQHAALVTELELTRAKEKELTSALEEQKRDFSSECAQRMEELDSLRARLADRGESAVGELLPPPTPTTSGAAPPSGTRSSGTATHGESPVMGSIMQQFSKLRQQRAVDRELLKKAR